MAFGDASYFIGIFDREDQWHADAVRVAEQVTGRLKVTDAAMGEALTMIGARAGGKRGRQLYDLFLDACEVIYTTRELFSEAMVYHVKYDGRLSTSDCLTIAAMVRGSETQVLSFDTDFDKVKGIHRVH